MRWRMETRRRFTIIQTRRNRTIHLIFRRRGRHHIHIIPWAKGVPIVVPMIRFTTRSQLLERREGLSQRGTQRLGIQRMMERWSGRREGRVIRGGSGRIIRRRWERRRHTRGRERGIWIHTLRRNTKRPRVRVRRGIGEVMS